MRRIETTNIFLVALSLLIGIFLTIIPLPSFAIWLRPQWVFAILLFWVIASPTQCGIGTAFIVGLLMDLVTGTPMGAQALVFVVLVYITLKLHSAITHFPLIQQAGVVLIFTLLNVLLQGMILRMCGHSTHTGLYVLSAITTAIIWPWLSLILGRFRPSAYTF